jgi:hypothetical protein
MHDLLHSALGQAVRWDLIATNPADRIEPVGDGTVGATSLARS